MSELVYGPKDQYKYNAGKKNTGWGFISQPPAYGQGTVTAAGASKDDKLGMPEDKKIDTTPPAPAPPAPTPTDDKKTGTDTGGLTWDPVDKKYKAPNEAELGFNPEVYYQTNPYPFGPNPYGGPNVTQAQPPVEQPPAEAQAPTQQTPAPGTYQQNTVWGPRQEARYRWLKSVGRGAEAEAFKRAFMNQNFYGKRRTNIMAGNF